jgi:pimeloyl-ACP methyl ester carboxylesterase
MRDWPLPRPWFALGSARRYRYDGVMPKTPANGIEIEYETFGDPESAPLLLVMGLGAQMISWDERFCKLLADRGFYVIRYDNRDSGLSTKMEAAGEPDMMAALAGDIKTAYELDDLADDACGLLDALGIPAAHIVGASMGGFISQLIAINQPEHVLSLTSIMSGPSGTDSVPPEPKGIEVLYRIPPDTRDERIEQGIWIRQVLSGPGDPFDEEAERKRSERAHDRSYYPAGTGRQLLACLSAKSRIPALATVAAPSLVIHGADDVLVPVENGRRVAAAIPGARWLEFEGMGHNLPERVWPQVIEAIAETAAKATVAQHR